MDLINLLRNLILIYTIRVKKLYKKIIGRNFSARIFNNENYFEDMFVKNNLSRKQVENMVKNNNFFWAKNQENLIEKSLYN